MRRGTAWLKLDERRMEFLSLSAEGCLSDSSCKAALFTVDIFAAFSLLPLCDDGLLSDLLTWDNWDNFILKTNSVGWQSPCYISIFCIWGECGWEVSMICPKLRARPLLSPSHLFLFLQASVPIGLAKKFADLFKKNLIFYGKTQTNLLANPIICKSEIGKQDSVMIEEWSVLLGPFVVSYSL